MPFDLRRAEARARLVARDGVPQDHQRVMRTFLETLARLAIRAARREAAR